MQIPSQHIRYAGCPMCKNSLGEEKIYSLFTSLGLKVEKDFYKEYAFEDLKINHKLRYDYYVPSKKLLIEYNGRQHYEIYDKWDTRKTFLKRKHYDWIKRKYAQKHNLKLLTIPYWKLSEIDKIIMEELNKE